MKWLTTGLVLSLALTQTVCSRDWFSKAIYNKWHQTELERWLSDHDIPYPTPADRKDLEDRVKNNWEAYIQVPIAQTAEGFSESMQNARDWVFDSWTDSQLKSFLDKHGIAAPQPRKRDTLLQTARQHYDTIAQKFEQTSHYPGNWLYDQWSESDLKHFLDSRGYNVPQPTTRDKLIAAVRRNARRAKLESDGAASSLSASMAAAQETLTEALFNAWTESDFKKFFDTHGIKVPQGSRRNEMVALARKHRHSLLEQQPASTASSAFGAATTKAGNEYARATDDAQMKFDDLFDQAIQTWSDSRLKAFLDSRGVPVPQTTKRDELLAKVRLHKHKASTGYSAWTFDSWNRENLGKYLSSQHQKALKNVEYSRDELLKQAQDAYNRASKTGGNQYTAVTNYLAKVTDSAKDPKFHSWSKADLEKYLESFGLKPRRGASIDELRKEAKRNADFFQYGTLKQEATLFSRLHSLGLYVWDQLKIGALSGRDAGEKAAEPVKKKASKIVGEL